MRTFKDFQGLYELIIKNGGAGEIGKRMGWKKGMAKGEVRVGEENEMGYGDEGMDRKGEKSVGRERGIILEGDMEDRGGGQVRVGKEMRWGKLDMEIDEWGGWGMGGCKERGIILEGDMEDGGGEQVRVGKEMRWGKLDMEIDEWAGWGMGGGWKERGIILEGDMEKMGGDEDTRYGKGRG